MKVARQVMAVLAVNQAKADLVKTHGVVTKLTIGRVTPDRRVAMVIKATREKSVLKVTDASSTSRKKP